MWYSILRNAIKEIKKMEIKRPRNIKSGTKRPDFTAAFEAALKELNKYRKDIPFFLRLIPSLCVCGVIFLIVVV